MSLTRRSWVQGAPSLAPVTAYQYDWNMLPIGQALWLKHLQTYVDFPPMQDPASYNLEQVMQQVREMKSNGLSWFECEFINEHPAGDHVLVLGKVIGGKLLDSEAEPMSYRETGSMDGASTLFPDAFGD